jgi:HK97 family phage prohead protease
MIKEYRSRECEIRAVEQADGSRVIEGYAAVWDVLSSYSIPGPKGMFWEKIQKGTFAESIKNDEIACFFDHNTSEPLGRKSSNTLTVEEDDHGLKFRCVLGTQSYANDLVISLSPDRRDVKGCSLGMMNVVADWKMEDDGKLIRTVKSAKLFDVGPVSIPIYNETEVALRSLTEWQDQREKEIDELNNWITRMDAIISLMEIGK